jgi:tetratricopeptide (TPR) repeat protein
MLFQQSTANFIGRNKEIELFEQWLNNETAPWILYFYDALDEEEKKGGIGKTWLLRHCAALAQKKNPAIAIAMIDFFNVADRDGLAVAERIVRDLQTVYPDWLPTTFIKAAQEYRININSKNVDVVNLKLSISEAITTDLQALEEGLLAKNAYLLVFFDTFEAIEQDPTIAVLHPARTFPDRYRFQRLRAIVAGRNGPDWTHANWQGHEPEVQSVALSPFNLQEMLRYLNMESVYTLQAQNEQTHALYERTNGRPILLGLVKDILNQRILNLDELVDIPPFEFEPYLVAQINKLENPLNWVILFMAHAYHRFNITLLDWIIHALDMHDPIIRINQDKLQAILPTLSFVRYPGYGQDFVLHDEMRRLVVRYCWEPLDPDRSIRREISRNIIDYYKQELSQEQNEQKRQPYTIEMLYHLLFADIDSGFDYFLKTFSKVIDLSMDTFARALLQETRKFWDSLSQEQRGDLTLWEVRLLRIEKNPTLALQRCLSLESADNKQWLIDHYADYIFEKGKCYQTSERFPEAITNLTESLQLENARDNEQRCANILSSLGYIHRRLGLFDVAVRYYEESTGIFKKLKQMESYAAMLNNVGNVYRIQGKIEEALQRCMLAWRIRHNLFQKGEIPEFLIGLSLSTLGRIYLDVNDLARAEGFFSQAFEIYQRTAYKRGIAATYNRFGELDLAKGNLQTAEEWFKKAQTASMEIDIEAQIESLNRQGRILSMHNQWQKAIPFFTEAISLAIQVHDHYQHVESLLDIANAQEHLDQHKPSQQAFQLAKEISTRENYLYLLGHAEEIQGDLRYKASEYRPAFKHYREYCRYMALYNTQEYSAALHKINDRLFPVPQDKILSVTQILTDYWLAHNMDKDYPELIHICTEVNELADL